MSKLPPCAPSLDAPTPGGNEEAPELRVHLAHEINNPLSFVLTNAELLLEADGSPGGALGVDERRRMLLEIVAGARRIRDVIGKLRPSSCPPPSEPREPGGPTPVRPSGARLLLVDDEPLLLLALGRLLGDHQVTKASSGAAALEAIEAGEASGRGFDLVLCDLLMPRMTGMTLFAEVERRWPEIAGRFVFITGSAGDPSLRGFLASCGRPMLEKPFEREALLSLVSSQLACEAG